MAYSYLINHPNEVLAMDSYENKVNYPSEMLRKQATENRQWSTFKLLTKGDKASHFFQGKFAETKTCSANKMMMDA